MLSSPIGLRQHGAAELVSAIESVSMRSPLFELATVRKPPNVFGSASVTVKTMLEFLSTAFRNYGDVLIWTSHGDTETQRRSTRAACTTGRAVRRADRKRTTEPPSSGRSFAVGTPRPPLRGAASSALPAACCSLCLCVSVAKYVVVFLFCPAHRHPIRAARESAFSRLTGQMFLDE